MHEIVNPHYFKTLLCQCLDQTFSPIITKIIQIITQQETSTDEVAKLIAMDPLLSASVISTANSPHYGYGERITTVTRAIMIMGLSEILKLAINIAIKKNLSQKLDSLDVDVEHDWRMTIWSAVAAEHIAKQLGSVPSGQAYLASMLKDVPMILMYTIVPITLIPEGSLIDYHPTQQQQELDNWGITHPEMCQILSQTWGLNEKVSEAMRLHHTPVSSLAKDDYLSLAVSLGTKWSELLQGKSATPEDIFNFEMMLRTNLRIENPDQLDELRLKILKNFREILIQLDISETPPDQRFYETSLATLKNYYLLSLDLADTANDLSSLAHLIGNHLAMFWQIPTWDLALKAPDSNDYFFFSSHEGLISQYGPMPFEAWTEKTAKKLAIPFTAKGNHFGELLIPKHLLMADKLQAFTAYASFANQSLGNYYSNNQKVARETLMIDDLPIAVATLNLKGELLNANKSFTHFFKLNSRDKIDNVPRLIDKLFNINMSEEWPRLLMRVGKKNINFLASRENPANNTSAVYLITLRQCENGSEPKLLLFIQATSEISCMAAQTLKQKDFLGHLFSSLQDIVMIINLDGIITWAPPALQEIVGEDLFNISSPTTPCPVWDKNLIANLSTQDHPLEAEIRIKNQRIGLFELILSPLDKKTTGFLVVGRDLTKIRGLEAKVQQQTNLDGLTGLYNRSYFHQLLETEILKSSCSQKPIGLLFMDLDGLKGVNNTGGHLYGDNLLKALAATLKDSLRPKQDFAARYGGDEFAVLATNVDKDFLERTAERLRTKIAEQTNEKTTLSIGITMLGQGQEGIQDFLKRGRNALNKAKNNGGNKICWGA